MPWPEPRCLALFAASLGAGPEAIGFAVAISTVTGIFFKMPAGVLSDVIGRTRTLFMGLAVFAVVPFAYLFVSSYETLVVVRFLHGFATAIYGPVAMAVVLGIAGGKRGGDARLVFVSDNHRKPYRRTAWRLYADVAVCRTGAQFGSFPHHLWRSWQLWEWLPC